LTLFSYEILGLVGQGGAGPHDLRRMVERGRLLAWAGESRYYTEPKRLSALGYLKARTEAGLTRERTVYSLTAKGRRALTEYARSRVELLPLKSDALIRLLICDLVGEPVTRASMSTLRAELDDAERRLDEAEVAAAGLPHREPYLLLGTAFMRRIVEAHRALVDDVERELSPT
jgi:DNA-binding PadR family transcriptional regulator